MRTRNSVKPSGGRVESNGFSNTINQDNTSREEEDKEHPSIIAEETNMSTFAPLSDVPPVSGNSISNNTSPSQRPRHLRHRSSDLHKELMMNNSNGSKDPPKSKWASVWTRTYTTVGMLSAFIFLIYLGHVPLMGLVFFCQVSMFKEIKRLSRVLSTKRELPSFRPLHWYWFATAIFFIYGRIFDYYFHIQIPYHTFLCFSLYVIGVLLFVFSLKKGYYKYQFEVFAWTQVTLLLIVVQSTFIVVNMFQGLIWFILPALLIISNDIWAYVVGSLFGRTPLIRLSPKKTWEGFIGAAVMTVVSGVLLAYIMSDYPIMICSKTDFSLFTHPSCIPAQIFVPQPYSTPHILSILSFDAIPHVINVTPFQLHVIVLAIFASLIAPFGGFFASGFKRAFHIKDFGESIPGHGGVTDRMDCQVLMGLFVWVYYWSFVVSEDSSMRYGKVMKIVDRMQIDEVQQLYGVLQQLLRTKGVDLG